MAALQTLWPLANERFQHNPANKGHGGFAPSYSQPNSGIRYAAAVGTNHRLANLPLVA
jgi:hypothetical protein